MADNEHKLIERIFDNTIKTFEELAKINVSFDYMADRILCHAHPLIC